LFDDIANDVLGSGFRKNSREFHQAFVPSAQDHKGYGYKPSLNTSNFITKTSNVQVQKMMNQTIRAFEIC
jgi:hypothetical protein